MSWWWGHLLPGTGWLLMALFHYLQSMNGVTWLKPLRTKPGFIAARSLAVMLFCVLGVAGEFIGERGHSWGVNNNQHLIIWGGFFTGGVVEFLHIFNYLKEPFWGVIPPVGMCYVGIMLTVHEQFRVFWRYLHLVSGMVTFPAVIILMYIPIRAMNNYRKKVEKKEVKINKNPSPSSSIFCCWRGKSLEDLNPVYTDLSVYNTVWPGLVAFFLCLESILWYEMAFRMGWWSGTNLPPEVPHAEHAFLAMLIGDIVIVLGIFAVTSYIARSIDKWLYGNTVEGVDIEQVLVHDTK